MTGVREIPVVLAIGAGSSDTGSPRQGQSVGAPRHPRRTRRIIAGLLVVAMIVVTSATVALLAVQAHLAGQVQRIDGVFDGLDNRPTRPSAGPAALATNILVMGTQRSDTMMVLHVDGDRDGASLIAIPPASRVDVPGRGYTKVNASVSGPSLAVETVENLTGVRIDHLAVVDWTGIRAQLGSRNDAVAGQLVRQSLSTLRAPSPLAIYGVLDTVTDNLSVDSGWKVGDLRTLARDLRAMRPQAVQFLTVPVRGPGREGDQKVLRLDRTGNQALWKAVREDRVARWTVADPSNAVGMALK